MTHSELVEVGYKWCLARCGFAVKELVTQNVEQPDVLGFNAVGTFLLEAKVSRSDFIADKKKPFRATPRDGMGDWRFFIVPEGLVVIEELPPMWGLIEVNKKGKAVVSYNPFGKGNIYSLWVRNSKRIDCESVVMYSMLRRLQQSKVIDIIYKTSHL